jgi:hypothetical protein
MKKHAKEGWDLANTRTLELRTANLQIDELKRHWFTIRQAANSMEDILTATEKRIRPTPKCEAAAYVPGYPCPACKQTHD